MSLETQVTALAQAAGAAIKSVREDLEMIGDPFQNSAAAGAAATATVPAPGPGQEIILLEVGFSYSEADPIAGVFLVSTDAGATIIHRDNVTSSGPGPIRKGVRCGEDKEVTVSLSAVSGAEANVNGSYVVRAV